MLNVDTSLILISSRKENNEDEREDGGVEYCFAESGAIMAGGFFRQRTDGLVYTRVGGTML